MTWIDTLIDWIFENFCAVIAFFLFLVEFIYNGKYKKEIKNKMEGFKQTFSNVKQEYELDERLNKLVESGTTDLQELLNSSRGTCLEELLKKMLPSEVIVLSYQEQRDILHDDLDELTMAIDCAEEYREKFGMPLDASIQDIYKRVEDEAKALDKKIKEVSKNEKKTQGRVSQESTPVSEHGGEDAQAKSSQDVK
ncbi:hypothetical protein [Sigmofec virus UA08Rod_6488]|uniref:Uncharacterized protein n=1 Tax=Sigmofec virus UA08Rod_6488 TaxID=2929232 RepID=A0A976N0N7_9VIRU|nr:hypothetical protein [Sigmofec virus UA08Rod_6488]